MVLRDATQSPEKSSVRYIGILPSQNKFYSKIDGSPSIKSLFIDGKPSIKHVLKRPTGHSTLYPRCKNIGHQCYTHNITQSSISIVAQH